MGGTYSADVAEFLFFGPDSGSVDECVGAAEDLCDEKGLETDGPIPLALVQIDEDHPAFDDGELFGQPPTEAERRAVAGKRVSRRILRVYNDADAIKEISSMELPDEVFLRVVLDKRTYNTGGRGIPHTFDPAVDYKTDP